LPIDGGQLVLSDVHRGVVQLADGSSVLVVRGMVHNSSDQPVGPAKVRASLLGGRRVVERVDVRVGTALPVGSVSVTATLDDLRARLVQARTSGVVQAGQSVPFQLVLPAPRADEVQQLRLELIAEGARR
jgi:hypothetical protein